MTLRHPVAPARAATTGAQRPTDAPQALIVDDDIVALIVVRHMLESLGLQVTQAANVGAALAQLDQRYDIVVADYSMPGRNGLDLLGAVDGVPFVLLSGVVEWGADTDSRLHDVSAHLTKPVSTEELRAVVTGLVPGLVDR